MATAAADGGSCGSHIDDRMVKYQMLAAVLARPPAMRWSAHPATQAARTPPEAACCPGPALRRQLPRPLPRQVAAVLLTRIAELEAALAASRHRHGEVIELDDQRVLQDVGIYRYHHPLENAAAYKDRLRASTARSTTSSSRAAVLAADMFTFDGSLAKGRKMVADLSKLMLRAYNAEADNCVRSLRSGNISTAKKRLESAVTAIEKLGAIMEMRVNPDYHALRVDELELTADYQMKVQEEREQAREERERLREQRRAEQELAAERERLEKERAHYAERARGPARQRRRRGGRRARRAGSPTSSRPSQANDYRIANIRAGYVYVISNIGAFGPNIVKIGMTRRLEPTRPGPRTRRRFRAVPLRRARPVLLRRRRHPRERTPQGVRRPARQLRQRAPRVLLRHPSRGPRRPAREGRRPARVHRGSRGARVLPKPRTLPHRRVNARSRRMLGADLDVGAWTTRAADPRSATSWQSVSVRVCLSLWRFLARSPWRGKDWRHGRDHLGTQACSTSKAKTAAVAIEWRFNCVRVADVRHPLPAADIAPLIATHRNQTWAVDVPFGWPDDFVALMAHAAAACPESADRRRVGRLAH